MNSVINPVGKIKFLFCFLVGFFGVYKGLTATVIKQGTNQMIRYFVYSNLKSWLQDGDPKKDIGSVRTFIIGGIAGAASVFGNTPVDVVKTRMQV
jgi:solute carrier family 25 citrate transporter 1